MRRVIAVFTSFMVAVCFLWSGEAFAAADYSIMRVTLTSMGTPTSISLTVDGNYSIPEKPQICLEKRPYQISIANGQLMLSDGTTSIPMGASFTIKRHEGANPNQLRISNTSYGTINYLGDFEVRLMDNTYIQLVNCIYLETYLYGVVPYEMSDSFPIEALKAQAIAARTYAVSHYPNIVDTTWDQVYKGYNAGYSRTIQAVNDTAKQVMRTANGALVSANYSASNGGQTELPSNAWLTGSDAVYNVMKDDPYDLDNPSSRVEKLTFPKVVNGTMNGSLNTFLQNMLISSLNSAVYSTIPGDITIKEIHSLIANTPYRGQIASKKMTNINITVFFDAINISNPANRVPESFEKNLDISIDSLKTALLSSTYPLTTRLFSVNETTTVFELIGKGWGHGVGMSQRGVQQMGTIGRSFTEILSFYYPNAILASIVANPPALTPKPAAPATSAFVTRFYQLCLNRDPDAGGLNYWIIRLQSGESTGGNIAYNFVFSTEFTSRNFSNNDFITIMYKAFFNRDPDTGGYSYWMEAFRNGISRYSVLAGFVNSQEFKNLAVTFGINPGSLPPSNSTANTPPPATPPPGNKFGIVTASKLTIRNGTSTLNKIVGYVFLGNRITILGSSNGWYKISYAGLSGYVSASYVRLESNTVPAGGTTPTPTIGQATVTASSLRLRSAPNTSSAIIKSLTLGEKVTILERMGSWVKVRCSDGKIGYVMGSYLK